MSAATYWALHYLKVALDKGLITREQYFARAQHVTR